MLWACNKFYDIFENEQIVDAVRRQLSWTHIRTLIYVDDALKRDFYLDYDGKFCLIISNQ